MKRLIFSIELLSDLVLSSTMATEGFNRSMSYIPGSKFLGIVAGQLYDENNPETIDLFHNGTVRFGDAHMTGRSERSFFIPADWHVFKGRSLMEKDVEIFLNHIISDEQHKEFSRQGKQLKRVRGDFYFTREGELLIPEMGFSLKSAYDQGKKRAKDGQMYGYFGLRQGTRFSFHVDTDDEKYSDRIIAALEGRKKIGRSRSAEYGLVSIGYDGETTLEPVTVPHGKVVIYADSNLCFFTEDGQNTIEPQAEMLGLPAGSRLHWTRSQVDTRVYQVWNQKRYNRDSDRVVIKKGSVIVASVSEDFTSETSIRGVGAFRSEGFGQLTFNPWFLSSANGILDISFETYKQDSDTSGNVLKKGDKDELILKLLAGKNTKNKSEAKIYQEVNKFKNSQGKRFRHISSSQWGQVRTCAKAALNKEVLLDNLFGDKTGILMHGKSENEWRDVRNYLKNSIEKMDNDAIPYTIILASEMAKKTYTKQ